LPRDLRGGSPTLSAAEVLTVLVWGAWRGLTDKAKLYSHVQTYHHREFQTLGAYSKFVEATNRYSVELRALLALILHRNRQAPRYDYEYQRNGVCNLFMFFDPLRGWRHMEVTVRRTRQDWAMKTVVGG
jgi:hypothetical protein